MKPKFSQFLAWLLRQKDSAYNFESPTDCVVARFVKAGDLSVAGGEWSAIFPGDTYTERLRNYHWLCGSKPMNYKCALLRASNFI